MKVRGIAALLLAIAAVFVVACQGSSQAIGGGANIAGAIGNGNTLGGTLSWQLGNGTVGSYKTPLPDAGQCVTDAPTVTGANASFFVTRNTNTTYSYNGTTYKEMDDYG